MTHAEIAVLVPALIAWALIAVLLRMPWTASLSDRPNERSLHTTPTPRIGGIGIAAGVAAVSFPPGSLAVTLGCALALWCISLADDLRSLPVAARLLAHAIAAAVAVGAMLGSPGAMLGPWVLALLAIVWATNLYNFMDGADGLAGGMAVIGFAAYAIAAGLAGASALAWTSAAVASAAAGFLVHNFPPARAFLGDCGSIPLGFLAGALGLHGLLAGTWSPAFPLLVFSPFFVDASFTLARRLARGEAPWRAHREHGYQCLVLAGWSHRRLALSAYALMLAAALSAFALEAASLMLQCGIIFAWIALYALIQLAIDRKTTRIPTAQ
jgi:UDP-N-acetylmuramyl pentapeptide phosphotransferase/UDP-N-acetylglucosamine-1-phosphate transferase